MHIKRTVTIDEQKSAIVEERKVRWHEPIATPCPGRVGVFFSGIHARHHRRVLLPDGLTLQSHLGERFLHLIGADIKKLFIPFTADFNPVTAPWNWLPKARMNLPSLSKTKIDG